MSIDAAASGLARLLRDKSWYHRTSTVDSHESGAWRTWIVVWGEGKRPVDCPTEHEGFVVEFRRVSKACPCPFGSVKAKYQT